MKNIIINTENIGDERLEYLIQFLKDCEYEYYGLGIREEMLQNLGYFICNDESEHGNILDKLLSYKGKGHDLSKIVPELVLWGEVEGLSYNGLMGAIQ